MSLLTLGASFLLLLLLFSYLINNSHLASQPVGVVEVKAEAGTGVRAKVEVEVKVKVKVKVEIGVGVAAFYWQVVFSCKSMSTLNSLTFATIHLTSAPLHSSSIENFKHFNRSGRITVLMKLAAGFLTLNYYFARIVFI